MSFSLRVGVLALLASGCTLVTEPWQYDEGEAPLGPLGPVGTQFERLKPGCGHCLQRQCRAAFEGCSADPECVEHAICRADDPTPPGYVACGGYPEAADYAGLVNCRNCDEACNFGANWECVGLYQYPPVPSGVVRYAQRLIDSEHLGARRPFAHHTVRACLWPGRCGPALSAEPNPELEEDLVAWTETDEEGSFEFELPVQVGDEGFAGIIVVSGPDLPTYRLKRTDEIVSTRQETQLFSYESLEKVFMYGGIEDLGPKAALVMFQVNDCWQRFAHGIAAGAPEVEGEIAIYTGGTEGEPPNFQATTANGQGTGAVLGLEGPGYVSLEFRLGDAFVNRVAVQLEPGEISLLQVGPGSNAVVEPW